MSAEIPTKEPLRFIAGDTVKWTKSVPDYLPADGWVLTYALLKDGLKKTITATDNGDGTHAAVIALADSANYTAGIYYWQAYVTYSGERFKVDEGRVEVKPNFATKANGYDARSHVIKTLEALEATIEGKATKDQLSYSINGRSIQRLAPEDLIKWMNHYKRLYQQELNKEAAANGELPNNKVQVRF